MRFSTAVVTALLPSEIVTLHGPICAGTWPPVRVAYAPFVEFVMTTVAIRAQPLVGVAVY